MHSHTDNSAFRGANATAMQDSPRHPWADRDANASYRYIPAPPGIKHPFAQPQPRYSDGARTTPSRSFQNHNHNTWTQKSENFRHQSNPRPSQHRPDDDNSSQSSYSNRSRSNMRHPSAQRRQPQQNNPHPHPHPHHENHRAVSADRRRSFGESPMRGEFPYRQSFTSHNGSTRHSTPHRPGWRQDHPQQRPGPPGPPPSRAHPQSTWSNYSAPRNPEAAPSFPSGPPPSQASAPPAPASDAASEADADDLRSTGPVKLPSTFEITDDLKKKYHMLESADGKIILLRKTPRGKRGGVKHRKNKLETVESLPTSDGQGAATETKSEDSDHSSSDVITVPGNGQRQPPPPPARQPNSPKRVQSIVSALNRQLSHTETTGASSPSHPSSPSAPAPSPAEPPAANDTPRSPEPPSPSAPDTPSAASEAEPPSTASAEDPVAKREAAKKKRLEELMREINDLRFAKQRAEEAQEQLSIQTQSLLQEKSSLLQRVGEREKQIANLQERLEYVELECEDLRHTTILDPQLLSVFSNGTLDGLGQLLPEGQSSLLGYGSGLSHDSLRFSGSGDLFQDSAAATAGAESPRV